MSTKTDEYLQTLVDNMGPLGYARLAQYHESAIQTAATAGLVVRPSTVAGLTIWNGSNDGGKSLVIDRLFTFNLVSTASQSFFSLWYCLHLRMTKPTAEIVTLRGTGDGREPDMSITVDAGATVLDHGWFPCGVAGETEEVGVLPGGMVEFNANGRLIVPPQHAISLQVVSSIITDTFTSGASWWRMQL